MNKRFKNYGLWLSVFAFIGMLCQTFNIVKLPDNYNELVNALLGILVLAGILNNPTTENKGYTDDTPKE
jgi:uncharacterized membrane protein